MKASVDTYLVEIHSVVHKIMSVGYFSQFLVIEILAFPQNWTRKQEVGHCVLILRPIFLNLIILKSKIPLMLYIKYQQNIPCHSGDKIDFIAFVFLALAAILDSFIILNP